MSRIVTKMQKLAKTVRQCLTQLKYMKIVFDSRFQLARKISNIYKY